MIDKNNRSCSETTRIGWKDQSRWKHASVKWIEYLRAILCQIKRLFFFFVILSFSLSLPNEHHLIRLMFVVTFPENWLVVHVSTWTADRFTYHRKKKRMREKVSSARKYLQERHRSGNDRKRKIMIDIPSSLVRMAQQRCLEKNIQVHDQLYKWDCFKMLATCISFLGHSFSVCFQATHHSAQRKRIDACADVDSRLSLPWKINGNSERKTRSL